MAGSSTTCRPKYYVGDLFLAEKRVFYVSINKTSVTFPALGHLEQCFSNFVRPRSGKYFFHKTRAQSQQIYS